MFGGARVDVTGGSHADLAIVHFPGEEGSGLPADGRPFFAHADRPNFGLALWVVYDAVKADWIIIAVNLAGSLTGFVIYHKLRERDRSRGQVAPDRA
jgi:hypothetical protein